MIQLLSLALVLGQTPLDRSVASVTYPAEFTSMARADENAEEYGDWQSVLPDCPCTSAEAASDRRHWVGGPAGCPAPYHPGAASGFRSRSKHSSGPGTSHGQQCCYDGEGRLLTDGPGAGTPDLWSPTTDLLKHVVYDVQPWWDMGWKKYEEHWVPNRGSDPATGETCPANGR